MPECDNVILFDFKWTLTEYVQSRGRARREKSKFIVIGNEGERAFYEELVRLEEKLMSLIPEMIKKDSTFDKILASQISLLDSNYIFKNKQNKVRTTNQKTTKFTLQIYLEDETYSDNNLKKLTSNLRKCKGFQESEISKKSLSNLKLFKKTEMIKCLFELKIKYESFKSEELMFILQTIKFLINGCNFDVLINFIPLKNFMFTNANLQVMCEEFEIGNLITPFLFCKCSLSFNNAKLIIQYEMKNILILFFISETLYKFEISFDSIDQLIVLSDNEESFDVYVPTKRPPFAYALIPANDNNNNINPLNLSNAEEEYLAWERVILDLGSSFHFKFGAKDKASIIKSLKGINKQHVLFANVNSTKLSYTIEDFRRDFKSTNFAISYSLECFISQCQYFIKGKICKKFTGLLNGLKEKILELVLEKLTFNLGIFRYCDILNALESMIEDSSLLESVMINLEKDIVLIRRITVFPSRIIFHFPTPSCSNRVCRKFGEENFIRVKFRDEDSNKLNMSHNFSNMSKLYSRIEIFLKNGLNVAGIKYDFLAMSASQMRGNF